MTASPQPRKVWPMLLAAAVVIGLLFWFLPILLPFILGAIFAYLMNPLLNMMLPYVKYRGVASFVLVMAMLAVLTLVLVFSVPPLLEEAGKLLSKGPKVLTSLMNNQILPWFEYYGIGTNPQALMERLGNYLEKGLQVGGQLVGKLAFSAFAVMDFLTLVFITPMVAFYLLRDWPKVLESIKNTLPASRQQPVVETVREMDTALAGFLRGQLLVCLILGIFYGTGFTLTGLQMGFALGLLLGALGFIPVLGGVIGTLLVIGVALIQFQFNDVTPYIGLAVVFALGSMLENAILTPKLVGDRVGLHPVWVIFALLAGGQVAGFVGMLVAMPMAAVLGVLLPKALHWWQRKAA